MNPTELSFLDSFFFFLIQALGSILLLFANDGCPTIFILGSSIVGIDRADSLGTGTVVFRVLSKWYSSTRWCDSSTVALECTTNVGRCKVEGRITASTKFLGIICIASGMTQAMESPIRSQNDKS
jgi:hypothetical protein